METTEPKAYTEDELKGLYDSEKRRKGREVMDSDKSTYARHLVEVTNMYRGQRDGFKRCMAEVERRCAKTHGFPEFTDWSPS